MGQNFTIQGPRGGTYQRLTGIDTIGKDAFGMRNWTAPNGASGSTLRTVNPGGAKSTVKAVSSPNGDMYVKSRSYDPSTHTVSGSVQGPNNGGATWTRPALR